MTLKTIRYKAKNGIYAIISYFALKGSKVLKCVFMYANVCRCCLYACVFMIMTRIRTCSRNKASASWLPYPRCDIRGSAYRATPGPVISRPREGVCKSVLKQSKVRESVQYLREHKNFDPGRKEIIGVPGV
jgi:hypothetical protein